MDQELYRIQRANDDTRVRRASGQPTMGVVHGRHVKFDPVNRYNFFIQLCARRWTYQPWYQSNSVQIMYMYSVHCGSGDERLSFSGVPAPCHLINVRHQRQLGWSDWFSAWRQSVGDGVTVLNDDRTDPVTARYHCVRYRTDGKSLIRRPVSTVGVQRH